MAIITINPAEVRDLFTYDPNTGVLHWAKPTSLKVKIGDVAGGLKSGDPAYRYWVIRIRGRRYRRSRLVWVYCHGEDPGDRVDHADRDKTNDRLSNLRLATASQNGVNSRHPKPVHCDLPRGVSPKRKNGEVIGYRGRAHINGRRVEVGPFSSPERAGDAVLSMLIKAHGPGWIPPTI